MRACFTYAEQVKKSRHQQTSIEKGSPFLILHRLWHAVIPAKLLRIGIAGVIAVPETLGSKRLHFCPAAGETLGMVVRAMQIPGIALGLTTG
jgi:hypothetical protein